MTNKFTEYAFILIIVFLIFAILLHTFIPQKHVCVEGVSIQTVQAMDVKLMFDSCVGRCNNNDIECLDTCIGILDKMDELVHSLDEVSNDEENK